MGYSSPVLSGLNIEVRRGEVLGVLGPNGSGKSTLLKTLMSALKPIAGTAFIDGSEIFCLKSDRLARKMSIMLTERVEVGFLTGYGVVALGRYPYVDAFGRLSVNDRKTIEECLQLVNADYLADRLFSEMSDGEKQKVLIARALAQEPEVILMDEPTSYLDARHKLEVMLLLRKIATEKNIAIILTTHDVELALRICDRVVLVKNGGVVAEGIPEEILTSEIMRNVYGVENARFEIEIGSFELRNDGIDARVHVVCGGGSGANLMRLLAKKGIAFTAGVVHVSDVDYVIARNTAAHLITEKPYREITDTAFEKAKELISKKVVIDSGFPVGEFNMKNLELLKCAKKILSLRNAEELEKLGIDAIPVKLSKIPEVLSCHKSIHLRQ